MTTMRVSDRGLMDIVSHEAIVPMPYRDSKDIWTCFIGHTRFAGPPDPLSFPKGVAQPLEKVLTVFRRDLAKFEARVNAAIKIPVAQHEFDAAVSFDFNTGGIHKASWVKLLNQGNRAAAAKAIMNWVTPPEVRGRRLKEQLLFRDGVYSSGGHATVYPATTAGTILWKQGKRVDLGSILGQTSAPDPGAPAPAPSPDSGAGAALSREMILDAQTDLKTLSIALGRPALDPGKLDGWLGSKTSAAVLAFQKIRSDLPDTGILDSATDKALDVAAARIVAEETPTPASPQGGGATTAVGAGGVAAGGGAVAAAANGSWGLAAFLALAALVAALIIFLVLRKKR